MKSVRAPRVKASTKAPTGTIGFDEIAGASPEPANRVGRIVSDRQKRNCRGMNPRFHRDPGRLPVGALEIDRSFDFEIAGDPDSMSMEALPRERAGAKPS